MKALTLRQPWAWAIASGHKTTENRSRRINYRGPLAIHAGAAWDRHGGADTRVLDAFGSTTPIDPAGFPGRIHFRAVIATARVVDCHPSVVGCCPPWGDLGSWHWVLADVAPLDPPVPATGRLGLWDIDLPSSEA